MKKTTMLQIVRASRHIQYSAPLSLLLACAKTDAGKLHTSCLVLACHAHHQQLRVSCYVQ